MVDGPSFEQWLEWARKSAREAAASLARSQGIPDLSEADAEEFVVLGRSDMREMIGRPVGVTVAEYREFKSANRKERGPDLDFMIDLVMGKHLTYQFLQHAR